MIMRYSLFLLITFFVLSTTIKSQVVTNKSFLEKQSLIFKTEGRNNKQKAYVLAKEYHWPLQFECANKSTSVLVGVNKYNNPIYYSTFNNTDAAATINTSPLWPSGSTGFNLSGSSSYLKNKVGIWDGGRVKETHKELKGRITTMDNSYNTSGGGANHATHVTGTMMASGINPLVKGMCYGLPGIITYDFTLNTSNDVSEVTTNASNLLVSNHSYGVLCGWVNGSDGWHFFGNYGDTVDYNFGYYNKDASSFDNVAFNAPYYLQVRAAGNFRYQNGPRVGGYYYVDSAGNQLYLPRTNNMSSNNSYQTIPTCNNAKNMVTVGAVYPVINGYSQPSDVIMTTYSSWGPTNDGRIKPDLVADGVDVLSTFATNDSAYEYDNGTSMATPSVTGSLLLLQEYYSKLHNENFMRAATLKGLAIHTANEAGNAAGPDYKFGCGLMNTQGAAEVIKVSNATNNSATSKHLVFESILNNGETNTQAITSTATGTVKATISWTDPAGQVTTVDATHKPVAELVNDLDLRITKNGTTYYPWVLNPNVPSADATTGDNYLDNVEQVVINDAKAGDVFSISVSHKKTLQNGSQAYSLIISQPGDTSLLPLKLINFYVSQKQDKIQLQWETANEVNIKSFEIETSIDGNNWKTIGTVYSKNLSVSSYYSYNISANTATSYFRLKMIDISGSFSYSSVVESVEFSTNSSDLFTTSPNPANSYITLCFDKSIKKANITVFDASGRLFIDTKINLLSNNVYSLPVNKLTSGVYTVSITANNTVRTKKVIIRK